LESDYLIHGVGLSVGCDHAETGERIREYLGTYSAPGKAGAGKARIRAEISFGSVIYPVPLHARRALRYSPLRSYFLEGRTYFTDYFSTLAVEPDGSSFRGNLSPDTLKDYGPVVFANLLFAFTLFEALRFHGLYFLHAAALKGPDGIGYLIVGNAGSGKTSLTLSLINAGFKFLSDDTVFLNLNGEKDVRVLGFPREFHVATDLINERQSLKHFSELPDFCAVRGRKSLRPDD